MDNRHEGIFTIGRYKYKGMCMLAVQMDTTHASDLLFMSSSSSYSLRVSSPSLSTEPLAYCSSRKMSVLYNPRVLAIFFWKFCRVRVSMSIQILDSAPGDNLRDTQLRVNRMVELLIEGMEVRLEL